MKALVVDDSTIMRKVVCGALQRISITDADHAEDGEAAVAAVGGAEYDIIFMDWNMPKMNGLDALISIREKGHTMPIVMVTTEAEKPRILDAIRSGATDYIVKPFSPETFAQKVKAILEKAAEG